MSIILCTMLLTATIEIIILTMFTYIKNKKESLFYILLLTMAINFVTNFLLNTFLSLNIIPYRLSVAILEPVVVITEALFYNKVIKWINIKQALLISFIANSCSFMASVVMICVA